jgi:hypothetical protein
MLRDSNIAAEKYFRLYIPTNVFIFRIYDMVYGK